MQFYATAATLIALAGAASAQTGCDAQNILNACVSGLKPQMMACASTDWDCLCSTSTQLLTCYNNCPSDSGKSSVSNQQLQYCNAAKAYGSSASASRMAATGGSSSGPTMTAAAVSTSASPTLPAGVTASDDSTSSQTNSGPVPTSSTINGSGTGAGSAVGPSFGGLVVVLAGAVAFL